MFTVINNEVVVVVVVERWCIVGFLYPIYASFVSRDLKFAWALGRVSPSLLHPIQPTIPTHPQPPPPLIYHLQLSQQRGSQLRKHGLGARDVKGARRFLLSVDDLAVVDDDGVAGGAGPQGPA